MGSDMANKAKPTLKGYAIIAILAIIIIEVLLFSIGPMTTGVSVTAGCYQNPGYNCIAYNYSPNGGGIALLQIGQSKDSSWQAVNLTFVKTTPSDPCVNQTLPSSWNSTTVTVTLNGSLLNGSSRFVWINMQSTIPTGTTYNGCLWASYQVPGDNQTRYAQIGHIVFV